MTIIRSIREAQHRADAKRVEGRRLVLVPTMGALHRGHAALVEEALRHGDDVTVSIFVNPAQFGPNEDFTRYPRNLEEDAARLDAISDKVTVFAPSQDEMYPDGVDRNLTWVEVEKLDQNLCGRFRPGHFRGVTTVVAKLLHVCKPHTAIFGLKDAQQFVILNRMVQELLLDLEIIGVPTIREPDGLALSSRNRYLSPSHRGQAVSLSRAIKAAEGLILQGEQGSKAIVESMLSELDRAADARVQYAELVDASTLQPIDTIQRGARVLVAVAVFFGDTRLIDSAFVDAPSEPLRED